MLTKRKCFRAKILGLLFLVITFMTLLEHWHGGKKSVHASLSLKEINYEQDIRDDEARIIPGLGEGGETATLLGSDVELGQISEKKNALNVYLSDRIPYNRTLNDFRHPACARMIYDAELPSVSVIIIFHNEPYSVLIRTIWSVLNTCRRRRSWFASANFIENNGNIMHLGYPGQNKQSDFVYIKEIILVDDNSTLPELKGKLSYYVRTRIPSNIVRILRLPERVGRVKAQTAATHFARGDVLVFMDPRFECIRDWLRPLLQRIKHDRKVVTLPAIDHIDPTTFNFFETPQHNDFEGLMKARTEGARRARGQVLLFLDAHCEMGADWLRPLLQRIVHKKDAVVTPVIDVIEESSLKLEASEHFQVGGFNFAGDFVWIPVSEYEKKRRGSEVSPTWSPTMAGGLFAMDRSYFWELGGYDEQMEGWGGENLELSFRIWMCGGTLETIPCSRVGHIFRKFHPYGLPMDTDTFGINTARTAEVWMDNYKELFYLYRPDLRENPVVGDVTHRKILREKLQCKSFQWYLDYIYRDKFIPIQDVMSWGRIRNPKDGICVDTLGRDETDSVGTYACHPRLESTQFWSYTKQQTIRNEDFCLEVPDFRDNKRNVVLMPCGKGNAHSRQIWWYMDHHLKHAESGLCLQASRFSGEELAVMNCDPSIDGQWWKFDVDEQDPISNNLLESPGQIAALEKIRGKRRISRSLMSDDYPMEEDNTIDGRRRQSYPSKINYTSETREEKRPLKSHKASSNLTSNFKRRSASKPKDKFILTLIRNKGSGNDTEHLELLISCKHTQLKPNNAFVRDLVSIFNSKGISVVNNGRVFKNNVATKLSKDVDPYTLKAHPKKDILRSHKGHRKVVHKATERPQHFQKKQNKIVIEEFNEDKKIELKTEHSAKKMSPKSVHHGRHRKPTEHSNKRKTTHRDVTQLPTAPRVEAQKPSPPYSASNEDSPPWGAHMRASDNEAEEMNEIDEESNNNMKLTGRRAVSSEDRRQSSTPPPVEFLLRSNLTFVLGDEFFNWNKKKDSSYNMRASDTPSESLAIPETSPVPIRERRDQIQHILDEAKAEYEVDHVVTRAELEQARERDEMSRVRDELEEVKQFEREDSRSSGEEFNDRYNNKQPMNSVDAAQERKYE